MVSRSATTTSSCHPASHASLHAAPASSALWLVVADERRARVITVRESDVRPLCSGPRDAIARLIGRALEAAAASEVALVMPRDIAGDFRAALGAAQSLLRGEAHLAMMHASDAEVALVASFLTRPQPPAWGAAAARPR